MQIHLDNGWVIMELPGCCSLSVRATATSCVITVQRNGDALELLIFDRFEETLFEDE